MLGKKKTQITKVVRKRPKSSNCHIILHISLKISTFWRWPFFSDLWHGIALLYKALFERLLEVYKLVLENEEGFRCLRRSFPMVCVLKCVLATLGRQKLLFIRSFYQDIDVRNFEINVSLSMSAKQLILPYHLFIISFLRKFLALNKKIHELFCDQKWLILFNDFYEILTKQQMFTLIQWPKWKYSKG